MAKIMFFAHDPGGANAILPLIEPLEKENEVFVFAKGPALLKLPNPKILEENTLKIVNPDFLITGTSASDMTEKLLWQDSKDLNIKSMAILDHWVNYGIRFSKYGLNEIEKFDKKCEFLPDYIIVMDEFAKQEMIKDGVPAEIIYPLGNPHFENLLRQSKNVKNVRSKFAKKNEFLITFASEPYTEDYGQGNEKKVLEDLIHIAKDKNIKIIVKLHPKEDFSKYSEFKNVMFDKETAPTEVIMASDLIVSMTSMFLLEAMILGKNILSYQPNETNPDKFILTRNKMLPFVKNKEDFKEKILNILNGKRYLQYNQSIEFDAVEKIIKFISEELCRK
ncbi:MAG TPA: polysialyltransferase family glycosyltransferase [Candidatus Gastranaerophilaceae bacterium]|nr:polysialyltransferase family glycosyltransferase [Candidatus Gastranaerophilaceae bacterium]HPT42115.1 polysialyltransferase family glycosyltransferase [Candidatus Gastranaerophilaceae bacterium]